MRNNKGFTIIELVVSFSITLAIVIVLFQIILVLKDLLEVSQLKTDLLNKQSLTSQKIYKDINNDNLNSVQNCVPATDYCLTFTFNDTITKNLEINKQDLTIKFGDYVTQFPNTTSFGDISFEKVITDSLNEKNSILKIKIPISNKLVSDMDYNIEIITLYNPSSTSIGDINFMDACREGTICKNTIYDIGNAITFGGYNWHVISNNDNDITLLMDYNQISDRSHTITGSTTYKWENSAINSYLNSSLLPLINANKISSSNELLEFDICKDETSNGGYPGSILSNNSCNLGYVKSKVRLLDNSEFITLKQYLINNTIDDTWLYSASIGAWGLSNGSGSDNTISIVTSSGTTSNVSFNTILKLRPVITVTKK